jgi:hypothetical protein
VKVVVALEISVNPDTFYLKVQEIIRRKLAVQIPHSIIPFSVRNSEELPIKG